MADVRCSRNLMKIALIADTPRTGSVQTQGYIKACIEAVAPYAPEAVEYEIIPALDADQPGGKVPPVAAIRKGREGFLERLHAYGPNRIISLGTAGLQAMYSDVTPAPQLKKEHGRMRWWNDLPLTPAVAPIHVIRNSDLHRDFTNVLYKVVTQAEPLPAMQIDTTVVRTAADLKLALDGLEGASVVGVDVETGGLSAYGDDLLAVGIGAVYDDVSGVAVVVPRSLLSDPDVLDLLGDAIWRRSRRSVGHNFKFDMQFLERVVGWPPEEASIGDTLLLAHLLDERPTRMNSRARGSGLKDLVAQRFDHQYGFDFDEFYKAGEAADFDAMHEYLGEDVVYTARLWLALVDDAKEEGSRVLETHNELLVPAARAIARCEWTGAPIDVDWVHETMAVLERRITKRRRVLEESIKTLSLTVVVDNIDSSQQIADVMYDEWSMAPDIRKHGRVVEGDRSTDKDHIEAAVARYLGSSRDRQARWLRSLQRLRKDMKVHTTYQKSLLDRYDDDHRVRASFLLHGTSTGRLSAQAPALQTIPAVKRVGADQVRPMRRAFAPTNGRVWCDVDYSQLELRVAAAISGDTAMAEVFRGGRDVHREMAASIFSKDPEDIQPAQRFLAKAVSFGIIYGRSAKALAGGAEMEYAKRELGMTPWTEEQATIFISKFLRSYPQLQEWISKQHTSVFENGYVESPFGRRRRFPLSPRSKSERASIERQAVNTPIQSAASDICLRALVDIQSMLTGLDAQVLFPVHDSICIECDESLVGTVEEICRLAMEKDFMGVPLTVDFAYGPDWATAGGWHA